jgi:hypothetical protein
MNRKFVRTLVTSSVLFRNGVDEDTNGDGRVRRWAVFVSVGVECGCA